MVNLHSMMTQRGDNSSIRYKHYPPLSFQARLLRNILQITGLKNRIEYDLNKSIVNHRKAKIPKSISKKYQTQIHQILGNTIYSITPKKHIPEKTILFLHGGAYVYGIQSMYWSFIKALIKNTKARIIIPDYPLAPEITAAETYVFLENTWEWILSFSKPTDLILLGDSAGAGLALGFSQKLHNENKPIPAQLILLSPWLDVTLSNEAITPIEPTDPILTVRGLQIAGKSYAGEWSLTDFRVSPIYGKFDGLPQISVFIGTYDILYPDVVKLKNHLDDQKIYSHFFIYPKLFHDWPIIYPKMKESQLFFQHLNTLINL